MEIILVIMLVLSTAFAAVSVFISIHNLIEFKTAPKKLKNHLVALLVLAATISGLYLAADFIIADAALLPLSFVPAGFMLLFGLFMLYVCSVLRVFLRAEGISVAESEHLGEESEYGELARKLDGIDISAGLKYSGGDLSSYKDVLRIFLADSRSMRPELKSLAEENKQSEYASKVRALKKSATNIGAGRLAFMAEEHEKAALRSHMDNVNDHLPALLGEYDYITGRIKELLDGDAV
ncbi:MAG: Hpt domain-containing protein [Lachnospiraceae bacterium]|nr:Hpt domain-containing protein [Lachnospiraceae bacterium]